MHDVSEGVSGSRPPQGARENLVRGLDMVANFQGDGGNLVDTIFEGLQEQSRLEIRSEPRRFIEVDSHEAVMTGDQERNTGVLQGWSGPASTRRSPCPKPLDKE